LLDLDSSNISTSLTSFWNKIAFVTPDSQVVEYPGSLLSWNDMFSLVFYGTDNSALTINKPLANQDPKKCAENCLQTPACRGFVYDTTNSTCDLKGDDVFQVTKTWFSSPTKNLYLRGSDVSLNNVPSTKNEIDAMTYSKYVSSGKTMDNYKIPSLLSNKQGFENMNPYLSLSEQNLYELAKQKNLTIQQQMEIFDAIQQNILDQNEDLSNHAYSWIKTMNQIQKEREFGFPQYNAMVMDSNQMVLEENYKLIFYTILAVGILYVSLFFLLKTKTGQ
jgi:hypothetical protein